jgi:hypothetical protein
VAFFGLGKTREQVFWSWFTKNESSLFDFKEAQEPIFEALRAQLEKVCPDLTFELSSIIDGKRGFIVSAEGLKSAFPAVEQLVNLAPSLPRWHFLKFRQRRNPIHDLKIGNRIVQAGDVAITMTRHHDNVDLSVFIPGVEDEAALAQLGFLFLDQALGEYDVTMKVGAIEFSPKPERDDSSRFPLTKLPERFDRLIKAYRVR